MTQPSDIKSFQDFCEFVGRLREEHPTWRAGQAAFNGLWTARQSLAKHIDGTNLDPFHLVYDDPEHRRRIKAFWAWLKFNWTETEEES